MKRKIKILLDNESTAGVLLLFCAIFAMIFKNSDALSGIYDWFVSLKIVVGVGDLRLDKSFKWWIDDALMAVFFFSIGLELKRERLEGQLKDFSQVFLPTFAAIGGVIFPAVIFSLVNLGDPEAMRGWAIPTATDIAFAVGVLALLGKRVPSSLKIFVLTLAIMDDLCAILIIAFFYSAALNFIYLGLAAVCILALILLNKSGSNRKFPYIVLSLLLWVFVLNSGIHATIAGVLAAFCIPLHSKHAKSSMLEDMGKFLHYPVSYIILPLFAFANAGISLAGMEISYLLGGVPMGIMLGLFFGKQIGIFLFSYVIIKLKYASMPEDSNWVKLYAIAIICGIGFTMALFVDNLAYGNSDIYHYTDKLGILLASLISGVVGYVIARFASHK